ncbi:MAG: rhomboid family intramembrane serine protease [Pseudomonadota bacterium]
MSDPHEEHPVNPIPPLILAIAGVIVALELVFQLGSRGMAGGPAAVGWRSEAIRTYGFSNRALAFMIETGTVRLDYVLRFVTYPFVHGSLMHALFASVMVLAIGKFVSERIETWAVLVLFFVSCISGALAFGLIYPDGPGLIGAFPGVYGLIGGFTFLIWLRLGELGENQMRAFGLIGFLMAFQLIIGLLYEDGNTWIADVAGFVAGFALSFVLVPGGWTKLREKLQRR